jgi:predicted dehydrogenase
MKTHTNRAAGTQTRRTFLKVAAAGAAAGVVGFPAIGRSNLLRDKLRIAVVGVGGRGWANIQGIKHEQIVALCDVDQNNLSRAANAFPDATTFRDYRRMLEGVSGIEAVLVATPDHTHAPATAAAIRMGKHVYCEKPLSHSVRESRVLADLVREHNVVSQMGTQIHAGGNYRRVVELVRSGAIGPVREAHVWCGKSWSDGRFSQTKPVPQTLEWDLWLGAAHERPYCDGLHPANWRRFWEYGGGTLGDMACHYMDLVHWALDLTHPTRVVAEGPTLHEVGTPKWIIVRYQHPATIARPACAVTWYDGGKRPEILKELRDAGDSPMKWGDGQLFIGDKGMIISEYSNHRLLVDGKVTDFEPPAKTIADSIGHHREWTEACKNGGPTTCHFGYSGPLSEAVLLGNAAFRAGGGFGWDGPSLRALGNDAAQALISKDHRVGWDV